VDGIREQVSPAGDPEESVRALSPAEATLEIEQRIGERVLHRSRERPPVSVLCKHSRLCNPTTIPVRHRIALEQKQGISAMKSNRQILIAELPKGKLTREHFKLIESPVPVPAPGEVLLKARYLVIDAAMRAWMLGPTYRAALQAGQVMAGAALPKSSRARFRISSQAIWFTQMTRDARSTSRCPPQSSGRESRSSPSHIYVACTALQA
jgi:N-terminal domain of oxidoreductase